MQIKSLIIAAATVTGLAVAAAAPAAAAKGNCVTKASEGTNTTEDGAKFQAYEALLQAVDWGMWAAWMSNGTHPGYDVSKAKYQCSKGGGLGYTCRSQATFCKKA